MTDRERPSQPIRVPNGLPYGQRQQLENLQRAQPLPNEQGAQRQPARQTRPGGPGPAPPRLGLPDVFGPTNRPGEPPNAGLPPGPSDVVAAASELDPNIVIRRLYAKYPHPHLLRLLRGE